MRGAFILKASLCTQSAYAKHDNYISLRDLVVGFESKPVNDRSSASEGLPLVSHPASRWPCLLDPAIWLHIAGHSVLVLTLLSCLSVT